MLYCDHCKQEVKQKIIPQNGGIYGCRACVDAFLGRNQSRRKTYNVNLGQTVTRDDKTRVTVGKAWQIDNRVQSPQDPKVYINKKTGRPTQY